MCAMCVLKVRSIRDESAGRDIIRLRKYRIPAGSRTFFYARWGSEGRMDSGSGGGGVVYGFA